MASLTSSRTTAMEIDWDTQEAGDDAEMERVLAMVGGGGPPGQAGLDITLSDINNRGEKAEDAEDYEDISDDDLPDEEEPSAPGGGDLPGLTDDTGTSHDNDLDDLFGEGPDSPGFDVHDSDDHNDSGFGASQANGDTAVLSHEETIAQLREYNFPTSHEAANQDLSIPAPAESQSEFVKVLFPAFEEGAILNWNDLLPPKKAYYIPKVPLKEPKPVHPTKVSLDIAPDQEKSFRITGPAASDKRKRIQEAEARGLVAIVEESSDEGESQDDFDWESLSRKDNVGKFTWTDLEIICEDWDAKINPQITSTPIKPIAEQAEDDWTREILGPEAKRRKLKNEEDPDVNFIHQPRYVIPSFDDFERAVSVAAKKVVIDLNDPYILYENYQPAKAGTKRNHHGMSLNRGGGMTMAKTLNRRFNISNDEAYDALKENHRSKVRATLGNLTVEHSLPALKLLHPYYKVKLETPQARAYHRPLIKTKVVGAPITFTRPGNRKRKDVKNKSVQEIFKESKDLSLGDHYCTATLLEYSEEHPTVLSNFGMGNRIINYYRKKNAEDTYRPSNKDYIGDASVLLPEDRSPFASFGTVDPGETVPTLHNAMYRAPIFKHETKGTDFLVIRTSTGIGGSSWHIRNIDNLFVVGQQFPSVEIPGPHSRKVTNAAKNRMKMIAYRQIRRHPHQVVKIHDITAHVADSNDMQNRQKLKEFLQYEKENKVWKMRAGEQPADETVTRSMVKPEDVCVIDAMQVGLQHLTDAGYAANDNEDEEEEGADGENLEQNMAPWKTSKAFLEASADKAMLQLHGAGDPSGCGLAFSFIKTSMKGGYTGVQGPSATSADAIARERKANGGHTYNVRRQQAAYNDAIRDIWEKQKKNLSDPTEHGENDLEREQAEEDERFGVGSSVAGATPAGFDDSASQISRFSNGSRSSRRIMRITRKIRNRLGQIEVVSEVVKDVRVWREYHKRRVALVAEQMNVYEAKPTGDAEWDRQQALVAKKELARLERNKERRHAREKQKGTYTGPEKETTAASPSSTPAPSIEKQSGTTRKCANCGLMGHIKTNKKLCPLLNGTMKAEDSTPNFGGFGAISTPSFSS